MLRGSWGQSQMLSKKSWAVVKANRRLLAFPSIGFSTGAVPLALFRVPAGALMADDQWPAGIALVLFVAGMNLLLAT